MAALEQACVGSGWTESAFEGLIQAEMSRLIVLRAPLRPAAAHALVAYCASRVVADEMEILSLAVGEGWRRQGLGGWLVKLALSLGARNGARSAFLEVRSGNGPARRLYDRQGFEEAGRRLSYYKNPDEDAIVLSRGLLQEGGRSES